MHQHLVKSITHLIKTHRKMKMSSSHGCRAAKTVISGMSAERNAISLSKGAIDTFSKVILHASTISHIKWQWLELHIFSALVSTDSWEVHPQLPNFARWLLSMARVWNLWQVPRLANGANVDRCVSKGLDLLAQYKSSSGPLAHSHFFKYAKISSEEENYWSDWLLAETM